MHVKNTYWRSYGVTETFRWSYRARYMYMKHGHWTQAYKVEFMPWKWDTSEDNLASHKSTMSATMKSTENVTQQACHYEDLLSVKMRKLRCYEHVTRLERLAKTILQGTVQRKKKLSKQKWSNSIFDWTGKSFDVTEVLAHNCINSSQLVYHSSTMQHAYDSDGLRNQ